MRVMLFIAQRIVSGPQSQYVGWSCIERTHPIVRMHLAASRKNLHDNRSINDHVVGLDDAEGDATIEHLYRA